MNNNLLSKSIADFFSSDTLLPVILCIGSEKVTGDALGPITGELLTNKYSLPCFVYGTLGSTVTALNVSKILSFIRSRHPSRKILVVDSGLGNEHAVGKIRCFPGGIKPGQGVGKNLPITGDFSVLGIVGLKTEAHLISSFPLGIIFSLAESISKIIFDGITLLQKRGKIEPSPRLHYNNNTSILTND